MTVHALTTEHAPAPRGHYSQGIEIGGTEAGEQTRQVLRNVHAVLSEAGLTLADVVKVTAHLQDSDRDWAAFDAAYAELFAPPYPVRTTAGSHLGDILVEIDVVPVRAQG